MKPFIKLNLLALASCLWACQTQPSLPDLPVVQGVSAPFAGFIGSSLIVAGGCNFPEKAAAEGGQKVYYPQAYSLDLQAKSPHWQELPALPLPVAYGASAQTGKSLACIGGMNSDSTLTGCFELRLTPDGASWNALPSLPASINNGAAACNEKHIYATGGEQPQQAQHVYALSLSNPTHWTTLTDYPGLPRVQPTLLATETHLYLAGGFAFNPASNTCTLAADILPYNIQTNRWESPIPLPPYADGTPRCLVGASGVRHQHYLIFAGGVHAPIFKDAMEGRQDDQYLLHEPVWYRFNNDILLYNMETSQWKTIPQADGMAKAGGVLLIHDNCLYMVCGETKPGIRTPQIIRFPLPESGYQE